MKQKPSSLEELERLKRVLASARLASWDWDLQAQTCHYDSGWKDLLGYEPHELPRFPDEWRKSIVHPEDALKSQKVLAHHNPSSLYESEVRCRHRDGHWVWVTTRGRILKRGKDRRPLHMIGVSFDSTQKKEMESRLAHSYRHNETLLRELTHRVNNNLQLIMSLMYMQLQSVDSKEVREAVESLKSRIETVALIYEIYTQSQFKDSIPVSELIERIAGLVDNEGKKLKCPIRVSHAKLVGSLSIKHATSVGLICVEIVNCALRSPLTVTAKRRIQVTVRPAKSPSKSILIWIESRVQTKQRAQLTPIKLNPLSARIVQLLAKQLGADFKNDQQGAKLEIRLK